MSDEPTIISPSAPDPNGGIRRGEKVFGDYRVEGELGRGGMGVVYRARQKKLNRIVALKMMTGHFGPDELIRFLAEAETAAGLHHTNIVQIYEVGDEGGAPFFSMEYIETGSLADRLRKETIPPREAAQLLISVARALHFAHQNGVVHRDMKPANILLDRDSVPKVTDFGIAKRLKGDTPLTLSGAVIGTPSYMAPEQAKGTSKDVGAAADVYSLGAILYEMLAGRPPFLAEESETALMVRVITEDPVSPAWHRPDIPRDLETICMKCLEKEPRDRYGSAAAFAEDLRRYLDDEPILARPPTTVVRTMKWIRRHPWRVVAWAAGFLVLAVAGQWLWQWEFYQRPHIEYAGSVEYVNGGLEPTASINKKEMSRHGVNLRLTRRGRRGPVTLVEVLNSRGNPAVVRPIYGEAIPIYMEGLMGAQPNSEKAPESSAAEFTYEGGVATQATGRDRKGSAMWRVLYDRPASSQQASRVISARFVNVRGFTKASGAGASHMEIERDEKGRDVKVTFFNAAGQPTTNGEGVYGYRIERDSAGRIVGVFNLGRDGQPAPNRTGQTALAYIRNSSGRIVRMETRDEAGKPASWNGISALAVEYDSTGNTVRLVRVGPDDKPVPGLEWTVQEAARTERGEIEGLKYWKVGLDGATSLVSEFKIAYDEFGHPADYQFNGISKWRTAMRRDANGNITEEKNLDAEGRPFANERGYAIKRINFATSAQGLRSEETYFDGAGEKSYGSAGYHRLINEFAPTGSLSRQTMDEHDPAQFKYYRYTAEPKFDLLGRLVQQTARYEDAAGQIMDAGKALVPCSVTDEYFDEEGRSVTEWQLGCVEGMGAPSIRIDSKWYSKGTLKRRVRQHCDAERKLLPYIARGKGALYEEDFDETDGLERIYESGFEESRAGFNTRETKFLGGSLQSVRHRRSDGTALESVRVIITEVEPQQPKAAELKAGDQLLTANGKPVPSAYHWTWAANFSGGWIEVLREGQTLRIEGFEPGALGVTLEDRAP